MTKSYELFCKIYVLLARHLDLEHKDLNLYLSDANPFIWKEESSWDPVVYEDFKLQFDSENNFDNFGFSFANSYFSKLDSYYSFTKKFFLKFSLEEYAFQMKDISRMTIAEMRAKYGIIQ